jgi:hypothetical protein
LALSQCERLRAAEHAIATGVCVEHGTVHNHFDQERHLISRDLYRERRSAALAEWRQVMG